ncbi:MAG: tRNA glutamyl-Q(34) synthetase GluQRS [Devosiaceae bacterium]|nr:tRNA glutamyl-Q(34) synthetase GluQRS [Devosiaceae bacterium]
MNTLSDTPPVLRFAPSPNGLLHLGHAYSALITEHWAKKIGGQWLLRIEDIDMERSKPEFVEAIFDDLSWLGLSWPEPVLFQSKRFDIYKSAAQKLRTMGLLYPCFCSRKEIKANARDETDPDGAPVYPGTCKHLPKDQISQHLQQNKPVQYRLNMEKAVAKTGMLTFTTAQPAPMDRPKINYARPARWGDVVIQRKGTPTSYHLSVVVDDAEQNITHITRGRDLQTATDIHVLLQFLLGLNTPVYTFHKLILDKETAKLSKSKGSTSLQSLRQTGWTAQTVRTHLGF